MGKIPDKYQPSGFSLPHTSENLSFTDYIHRCQQILAAARVNGGPLAVLENSPYELSPSTPGPWKQGVLLVHGFLESPFAMTDLAHGFAKQGYLVRSILLPGHGTRPGDLLHATLEQWQEAIDFGIRSFQGSVEKITLCGFSGGAACGIRYCQLHPGHVDQLITLAPAIGLRTKLAHLAHVLHLFGFIFHRAKWYRFANDLDPVKYESFPFQLIKQTHLLGQQIKQHPEPLQLPLFMSYSVNDETIDCAKAKRFFFNQVNPENKLFIYSPEKHSNEPMIEYRNSHYPEGNILNFSHISLHIAPDNPHYGRYGTYHPTLHEPEKTYFGARKPSDLSPYYFRRLTYNPDFAYLLKTIIHFLET